MDEFEALIEELERLVGEEERSVYSATVIEHYHNPRNLRRMEQAKGFAVVRGWCGDTMEIYVVPDAKGRIREASFVTDGCGPTLACGSMLTTMVCGKSLEQARQITARQLIDALNGLPEESVHCAELAVNTLGAALAKVGDGES
ncbi:MAG: iron-sulfur cluster assembly scaffold protein [Spirochaetales bacterium]|nr:iron-sulfur cluster assembly scaffold protein [Spirochaetales bacterium]